ncbi:MAG: ATP-binding protein, partial [Dolichospermum sp.]
MSNPFFPGKPVPPEHFVGRTSEIDFTFDQIVNRNHCAIWGGPGMGKTSFLRKIASEQALTEHGIDPSQAVVVLL